MELKNIQTLRAIAAISVVIDHILATYLHFFFNLETAGILYKYLVTLGYCGVAIFFCISGFLMIYTTKNNHAPLLFIIKRVLRIYPLYIILSIPIILLKLIGTSQHIKVQSSSTFISNLILLPISNKPFINYPAWTLVYELFFYFILWITLCLSKLFKFHKLASLQIFLCITLFLFYGGNFLYYQHNNIEDNSTSTDITHLLSNPINLYFLIGGIIAIVFSSIKINFQFGQSSIWVLILGTIGITLIAGKNSNDVKLDIYFAFIFIITIVLFCITILSKNYQVPILYKIGSASYSLYLIHPFLIILRNQLFIRLSLFDNIWIFTIACSIFFLLTLLISWKIYLCIEKPIMLKSKNLIKILENKIS